MQSEGLQAGFESELILIGSGVLRCQDLRARVCVWGGRGCLRVWRFRIPWAWGLESSCLGAKVSRSWDEGLDSQILGLQGGRLGVTRSWGLSLQVRV